MNATIDSAMDILASGINLFAIRHALQPADAKHRFGHGKAEPLAGLAQTLIVTASGAMLAVESVHRLNNPQPVEAAEALARIDSMPLRARELRARRVH